VISRPLIPQRYASVCGPSRSSAALCAEYEPKIIPVGVVNLGDGTGVVTIGACMSVLPQRFADPALGELVLADDALGVDPQQHVDAVPSPLRHLGRVHAAIEPRGQAAMPEVIRPPRERLCQLSLGEGHLARLDPRPPVGDRGQFAAAHSAEEATVGGGPDFGQVIPQQPRQLGMDRYDAAVSFSPMLELPSLPRAAVVGPLAARIGRCAADVQLTPVFIVGSVRQRKNHVVRLKIDRFLGTEPGVVHHREERDQPRSARLLGAHCPSSARA
jgi:hypothetical protein